MQTRHRCVSATRVVLSSLRNAPHRDTAKHALRCVRNPPTLWTMPGLPIAPQDIIDGRLEKRRRGVFGPAGGKSMAIFVDDLGMPQAEEYGAQPPIELLRQALDQHAWYDRRDLSLRHLEGLAAFVAAMAVPRGGTGGVAPRLLRHFSVIRQASARHLGRGSVRASPLQRPGQLARPALAPTGAGRPAGGASRAPRCCPLAEPLILHTRLSAA